MEIFNSSSVSEEAVSTIREFTSALEAMAKKATGEANFPLWNIESACQHLNISESKMRSLIFKKKIPFIKVGRAIRFQKEEIEQWLEGQSVKTN